MNLGRIYRFAWRILPHLPRTLVYGGADIAARVVARGNGGSVRQLRSHYAALLGQDASQTMVRQGVQSYFRSFAEQFTLPGFSTAEIRQACVYPGVETVHDLMKDGPVVLALTHSGNWDMAGAWFSQGYGTVLTVAEKLEPPELFDEFVKFRNSLGLEIIGVGPGEHVFEQLKDQARGRSVLVPLLADRDISGSGVEVMLGSQAALVAAGPAALAEALDRPLIAGHISYRRFKGKWQLYFHFTDPIPRPTPGAGQSLVEAWTKAWVEAIAPIMQEHVVDWHMMQKLYVKDLDPARLERARKRALENRAEGNEREMQ